MPILVPVRKILRRGFLSIMRLVSPHPFQQRRVGSCFVFREWVCVCSFQQRRVNMLVFEREVALIVVQTKVHFSFSLEEVLQGGFRIFILIILLIYHSYGKKCFAFSLLSRHSHIGGAIVSKEMCMKVSPCYYQQ